MELKKHKHTITDKMQGLPVSGEAKMFYLSNCEMQDDYIKEQQDNGVDPPKIKLNDISNYLYRKNNELTKRDMDSIVEELIEASESSKLNPGDIDNMLEYSGSVANMANTGIGYIFAEGKLVRGTYRKAKLSEEDNGKSILS